MIFLYKKKGSVSYILQLYYSTKRYKLAGILGAFAKLGKVTISVVMSVCPSLHPHAKTRLSL
jgi:hypothetical protein